MNIKFTVITVCYNASATIRETIASVLGQTYRELEYIVVDGKSTDGTVEVLESIGEQDHIDTQSAIIGSKLAGKRRLPDISGSRRHFL